MSTAHTPGPWLLYSIGNTLEIQSDYKAPVIHWAGFDSCLTPFKERRANARRIVACVNACEGITTEALEAKGILPLCALELQRDQLLAAAERVCQAENLTEAKLAVRVLNTVAVKIKGGAA